jgi:osmotically-inducible protein OsmY
MFAQAENSSAEATPSAPDNTGRNVRDRNANALTPFSQSNSASDVDLTRRIRRAVTKDKSLSTSAENIKIITSNGAVTLRGPVRTQEEKTTIARKARQIAGADKVDDQLEIMSR